MNSMWTDAMVAALKCPFCPAMNRRGVTYIEPIDEKRAYCSVCSKSGPLEQFQKDKP